MKTIIVLTTLSIFMCILITACNREPPLPESDRLAYKIAGRVAGRLKNKYDLNFIGVGLAGNGDETTLKSIKLNFSLTHLVTKEEGRELILKCIEDFLHEVNDSEELRPYLISFPFTYKNIELVILFYSDTRYESTLDPDIWSISLVDDVIYYKIASRENEFRNKSVEKESYEDALNIQNRSK